jgi:hypothetical protein
MIRNAWFLWILTNIQFNILSLVQISVLFQDLTEQGVTLCW